MVTNTAFVFVKPHAVTPETLSLVSATLTGSGLRITREGEVTAERIDADQLVDRHYYAIASKATLLDAAALNVPEEKFRKAYGVEWSDVLARGLALNSKKACEKWKMSADAARRRLATSQAGWEDGQARRWFLLRED